MNTRLRNTYLLVCFVVLILLSACSTEDQDINKSREQNVELKVNALIPRDVSDIPLSISNYRLVLAEQVSGFIVVNQTTLDNSLQVSLGSTISVSVKPGKYRAYLIANELNSMTSIFSKAVFADEILKHIVNYDIWKTIPENSIPLLAVNNIEIRAKDAVSDAGLVSDNGGNFLDNYEAFLERVLAKVSLRLSKKSPYNYVVKSVNIKQAAKSFYIGKIDNSFSDLITMTPFSGNLVLPDLVNSNYESIFENLLVSEKLFAEFVNREKATIVEVNVLINNIPITYQIPLGIQNETDYSDYQVKRNTHYLIQGTLSEIGDFTISVLPWEKENISTEFDPSFAFSFSWKPWMAQIDANQVAISYDSPAECEFVLTKPSGKRWVATLSNGADFEFDYSNNGVSHGISGMDNGRASLIRVKAKRKLSTGATTTLSIYTEDGRMVPLNPANGNVYNIILRAE